MMGTPHDLDQAMSRSKNLGKCTKPHEDLGPDLDECPLFDSNNPSAKFCGACGCHTSFHVKPNLDSRDDDMSVALDPKHKIFLSHSGKQKDFVEQLCVDLERFDRYAFFDKDQYSLPVGENFPQLIFRAIHQCHVGVVVLSEDFFTSKWPMMELVAMVDELMEREYSFKIIPVFLHSSLDDIRDDSSKLIEWKSLWDKWALDNPKRINVKKWEATLKYLRPINGLKGLVYDKLGEVEFRKVIVDAICNTIPSEIKFEVSHIQGSSRLCEVIKKKIVSVQQKGNGVCVMGLFGMGGIGKTSICKVSCNKFSTEFKSRVCHAELERKSEKELLQDVLEALTDTNPKLLHGLDADKLQDLLKRGIGKQQVFLALDNMSDTYASMKEVERYLSQSLMPGSIVMVTTRSLGTLMRMKPYMDESNCIEMPELEVEEARSLFTQSLKLELRNEVNEHLIMRCVDKCHFQKDNGKNHGYHYLPLALDVLGRQLRGIDSKECKALLNKIDEDIFNHSSENDHPIFSILRTSFDSLSAEDQLLFMDVALYLPEKIYFFFNDYRFNHKVSFSPTEEYKGFTVFKWLGMVHGIASVPDVMRRLERLKRRSLLESLGDGINSMIGMHDLWRAFCVAETKNGKLECQRWVYDSKKRSKLVETTPSGIWQSVERMAFVDFESKLRSLEMVNFNHFRNVSVLKLWILQLQQPVLDLSGLIHLKSLEVTCLRQSVALEQQLKINYIGCLEELQYLQLTNCGGSKLPDMRSMLSLRVAILIRSCYNVDTLSGLSLNLRVLNLHGCEELHGCPGVADLIHLKELEILSCGKLKSLPDLRNLKKLWKLDISECPKITELPDCRDLIGLQTLRISGCGIKDVSGLSNLSALERLKIYGCKKVERIPDLRGLRRLKSLEIMACHMLGGWNCTFRGQIVKNSYTLSNISEGHHTDSQRLTSLQQSILSPFGSAGVTCIGVFARLERLECQSLLVEELPDLSYFLWLKNLRLKHCGSLRKLTSREPIDAMLKLKLLQCTSLTILPDLCFFPGLVMFDLESCHQLTMLSCSRRMTALTKLYIRLCPNMKTLPDLEMFPGLPLLNLNGCTGLTTLSCSSPVTALSKLILRECKGLTTLPDLGMFPALFELQLYQCSGLTAFNSSGPLAALEQLQLQECKGLTAVPDLGMFPALLELQLDRCNGLTALSCSSPVTALSKFILRQCKSLTAVPDLGMFPALLELQLDWCNGMTALSSSSPVTAMSKLILRGCKGLTTLPDLGMFPALLELQLDWCNGLTALRCSSPVTALSKLILQQCESLTAVPDLGMFPALLELQLDRCNGLTALSCSSPVTAMSKLILQGCEGLTTVPDLGMFPALLELQLDWCNGLTALSYSSPVTALSKFILRGCEGLTTLPDLGMFPTLLELQLDRCNGLTALSCSSPVIAMSKFILRGCKGLTTVPDLGMFPALLELQLCQCSGLTALSCSSPVTAMSKLILQECKGLTAVPDLGMFPALLEL